MFIEHDSCSRVHDPHRPVVVQRAIATLVGVTVPQCLVDSVPDPGPVVRVNAAQNPFQRHFHHLRPQAEDAVMFVRPCHLIAHNVSAPTADVSEELGFGQHRLLPPQLLLGLLELSDVAVHRQVVAGEDVGNRSIVHIAGRTILAQLRELTAELTRGEESAPEIINQFAILHGCHISHIHLQKFITAVS